MSLTTIADRAGKSCVMSFALSACCLNLAAAALDDAYQEQPIPGVPVENSARGERPTPLDRFHAHYRLADGEAVKCVPTPFGLGRLQYWTKKYGKKSRLYETLVFHWDEKRGELDHRKSTRAEFSVDAAVRTALSFQSYEYRGLELGLETMWFPPDKLKCDWIVRTDATAEHKLRDLAKEIKRHFGRNLSFEKHVETRDVFVVTGDYKHAPLPGGFREDYVHLVSDADGRNGGRNRATLQDLVETLGDITETPVVNLAKSEEGKNIRIAYHRSGYRRHAETPEEWRRQLAVLLKNFTLQTGLKIEKDRREVVVWHASEAPGPQKPKPVTREEYENKTMRLQSVRTGPIL